MPVYLDSISFKNPLDTAPINWLLANVGDEITIEIAISVKTFAIGSTSQGINMNVTDGYLVPGVVSGFDFSEFKVGDIVNVYNYMAGVSYGNYTVVEIISNTQIRFSTNVMGISPATDNNTFNQIVFSIVKPITALNYKWNFIENAEGLNYFSKIDGQSHLASITNLNPAGGLTNLPMTFMGQLPYQLGSIEVDEVALVTAPVYTSKFIIRHKTRITPTILDVQWDDTVNNIAPDYFFNLKCLKSVFFIEARSNINDPNDTHTLQIENVLGNTGWFDEKWNANVTNYYIENLEYFYMSGIPLAPTLIPGVELSTTRITEFKFKIRNTVDSPFVSGQTKMILNFQKAPNSDAEYTNNNRDVLHNFVWETALLTASASPSPVNGDNYSDLSIRSISDLRAFYISANEIEVTGKFAFDQAGIDVFEESNEPNYLFYVSIQDHTKNGGISDRVTLKIDANNNFYQTSFPDLLDMSTKLIPHDVPDYVTGYVEREKFTEDELVGYTRVDLKDDPLVLSTAFTKYTARILAFNTVTGNNFQLESKSINIPTNTLYLGFPIFNIQTVRPFHVPANEIRKKMIARRNTTFGRAVYEFAFPFLNRWEYWVQLLTTNNAFLNISQPNNGVNEDWRHYNFGNWVIRYVFELNMQVNGIPALYTDYLDYKIFDRNLPAENTSCVIDTFDPDTLTALVDGVGNKYILGYKNTLVKATFTDAVDGFDPNNTTVVIGIEVKEQGGHFGKFRMSSKWVSDSDTIFIPLTGQTKVKLTFAGIPPIFGNTCVAEALVDFNGLDLSAPNYKLTARIYGNDLSSPYGTVTHGQNYLGDQYVKLIPVNPITEETIVLPPKQLDCCSDLVWRVLADAGSNDPLKNDINNFIFWFNKDVVDVATLTLVSSDLTEYPLTGINTYGTAYDYGFDIMPGVTKNGNGESAVGYKIDWRNVLTTIGQDTYYIKCDTSTIFGASKSYFTPTFCLKQYTLQRANGTVRVEYLLNGIIGDNKNDTNQRDYLQSNWYNQYRFDGLFHYTNSSYKTYEIIYENGLSEQVEDEQTPEYVLKLKPIPSFKHDILRTDILMANAVTITDYNDRNIDNYEGKQVIKNGSYEPKFYPLKSKLGKIDLKFKQAYNNLKKYRN